MTNIVNNIKEIASTFSLQENFFTQKMSLFTASCITTGTLVAFYLFDHYVLLPAELYAACSHSDSAHVRVLLQKGVPINPPLAKYFGYLPFIGSRIGNPLTIACTCDSPNNFIQELINSGADLNAQDRDGTTALMRCTNKEMVRLLLDNGANINIQNTKGYTALHIAMLLKKTEIAKALIEAGADLSIQNQIGVRPINMAVSQGNMELVKFLLHKGADIDLEKALFDAIFSKNIEMIKFVFSQGVNIDAQNKDGNTPLHLCCSVGLWGSLDIAKYLIAIGADVNIRTNKGLTPLDWAYAVCNDQAIDLLKSKNAESNSLLFQIGYVMKTLLFNRQR